MVAAIFSPLLPLQLFKSSNLAFKFPVERLIRRRISIVKTDGQICQLGYRSASAESADASSSGLVSNVKEILSGVV
jgi:hypothetical protein